MLSLQKGTRISNFLLVERIGAGAFGEVWTARHHVFDQTVAIKVPTHPDFVRNLQREGVVIHGLQHPNIVRAIDLDPYADPPYLIMEYVAGPSLRRAIEHCGPSFPVPAAITILRGVLSALTAAHAHGVIHRDLKPENILLAHPLDQLASIREGAVKVTDFGLGRAGALTTDSMLQSGSLQTEDGRGISGTLAYMSPEQREGQPLDARSDLYACGILLFEMLTGERPQGTEVPSLLRPGLPLALDEVFRRAYTRLERRYSASLQMYEALGALRYDGRAAPAVLPGRSREAMAPPGASCGDLDTARGLAGRGAAATHCDRCQGTVAGDDQFCIHCGAQLASVIPRCGECGGYVQASDRFCIFCGTRLQLMA
ncbi:MAG: protein kinase [Phycisphaerales bacterium]|nr:protein kinase [Phycisphaerales bacterium]